MIKHILVPLDGSSMAEKALDHAVDLVKALDGTLTIVRVVTPPPQRPQSPIKDPVQKLQEEEAEEYMVAVKERLEALGVDVDSRILIGDSAQHIVDLTESEDCDLVVMSSHGLGGSWHVYGSVAQQVLHQAHVPVMIAKWGIDGAQSAASSAAGSKGSD
jgi:nucleotide-binding universal stress UspA family protein